MKYSILMLIQTYIPLHLTGSNTSLSFPVVVWRFASFWLHSLWQINGGGFVSVCRMRLYHTTLRCHQVRSRAMSCFGKDRLSADTSPTHLASLPWTSKVMCCLIMRFYSCWKHLLCCCVTFGCMSDLCMMLKWVTVSLFVLQEVYGLYDRREVCMMPAEIPLLLHGKCERLLFWIIQYFITIHLLCKQKRPKSVGPQKPWTQALNPLHVWKHLM